MTKILIIFAPILLILLSVGRSNAECSREWQECETTADCCNDGYCKPIMILKKGVPRKTCQPCKRESEVCTRNDPCCGGGTCKPRSGQPDIGLGYCRDNY